MEQLCEARSMIPAATLHLWRWRLSIFAPVQSGRLLVAHKLLCFQPQQALSVGTENDLQHTHLEIFFTKQKGLKNGNHC